MFVSHYICKFKIHVQVFTFHMQWVSVLVYMCLSCSACNKTLKYHSTICITLKYSSSTFTNNGKIVEFCIVKNYQLCTTVEIPVITISVLTAVSILCLLIYSMGALAVMICKHLAKQSE